MPYRDDEKAAAAAESQYAAGDKQIISITDLISEGPIYGLVDAQSSVFLNDDRASPLSQAAKYASQTATKIFLTNGSTTATILDGGSTPIINATNGDKYITVRAVTSMYVTASNGSTSDANGNTTATLTTQDNAAFFNDTMLSSPTDSPDSKVPVRLLTLNTSHGLSDDGLGEGYLISRTSTSVAEFMPGSGMPAGLWIPDGTYFMCIDRVVKIASISGATITLATAWPHATLGSGVSYHFDVSGAIVSNADVMSQTEIKKYKSITSQFRVGTLGQGPFEGRGGVGGTSIANSPSAGGTIEQTTGYGSGSQGAKVLVGSAAAGFNLSTAQLQEVDETTITFNYGGGHKAVSNGGSDKFTYTSYKIELAVKKAGAGDFENYVVLNHPLVHSGKYNNAISFVKTIDLTSFRPFVDFRIKISRISDHTGDGYETSTKRRDGWTNVTSSSISTVTSVLKEVLTHPYSALAKTTFDTKQFRAIPTRSYHVRGLKIKVPSNYVTREQSADGIANYRRNISNGDIESTYQDWDGALALNKVYSNNPAWVFYDVLTNNRYGLGDFLQDSDIDKYSLYRIARYCDELVPDGKGGQEPRFTANLYFTKQADAYKMLKDMATVFRSMIYYFDGQVSPVIDAPSGPVYNFTKSNVIDGRFGYESTGSKTRINQVIVTWTNPDANYKAEPLIVEDKINIATTGKLISQTAVAMGANTEGQALRYGRWKLWTAANQKEIVTFSTSLNASFLVPGDVINVQDADRSAVRLGGRVSNSGTDISTVSIPLDNPTTLNSGSTYELSIIFVEPAAFATSDITIAGVDYKKGDIIKQAYLTGSSSLQNIDTETKSLNARASSGATDALVLTFGETTRVETKPVSTSAGLASTLTVSSAFSALPAAETVWVMTEVSGGAITTSSAKPYKILGLAQNSKNEYTITAVEHYDEKFNAVDEDFSTYIADTVYPPVIVTDDVPQPLDVFSTSLMRPEQVGEELTISWTPPANLGSIPGEYEHTFGYEITHDFPDYPNPIRINDSLQTNWSVQGITDGSYNVAVRTINTLNNLSEATRAAVTVSDRYKENIPRMPEGVPYTGTTSVGFGIVSDTFIFKRYAYTVKSPSGVSSSITNTNTTTTAWQQSCSTLPVISWSESDRAAEGEFVKEHAYILLDASDSTDRLKLLKYYRSFGVGFWYDAGSGNNTNKYGSALTGTFSKAADTSKVTGSGTAFLTQIKEGDILKLGSTEGYRVAAVVSDTLLYVTNSFSSFSGVQGFVPNIRIDYANDFIIARVYNTSSGLVLAESYAKIDAVLKPAGDIVEEGGVSTAEIAENAVTVEEIDTSASTGGTFGAAVAALDAASFSSIDTDVLDANSVIAREVQVFPAGGTAPTISGTTLAGAGIDLKQDGDMYVGNASANKYMFWDQSEGTMTFRGTLNVDDIIGSSATFGTLMAEVATIGTLNTKMLDSDAIVTRDIRVGPSDEITAGSFVVGTEYYITDLGNTTQAQWNSVAGTSGVVYNLGGIFTAANAGTGTGKARNRTTVAKIANTTLTGSGAHLNAAGDFYVGNASANKYMFWDQSAGTMTLRGELNADDITAGNITAANINVTNLQAISANLGNITAGTLKGGTIPEASSAPTTTESGTFFDLTGGRMVLGNASKYIWWNGTNLEINGVTISDATLSGSTGFATETFVNTAINNLVANAPAALDTLNEIAAALDDDASFPCFSNNKSFQ